MTALLGKEELPRAKRQRNSFANFFVLINLHPRCFSAFGALGRRRLARRHASCGNPLGCHPGEKGGDRVGPFTSVDWGGVFIPQTPLLEIFVRGTIVYFAIFALLRFVLKRQSGSVGVTDLLVVVLIADAAQNAMAGNYKSVPDGLLLVSTIIFWSWFIDWLGDHIPAVGRLVHPPPQPLVRDGKLLRRNMRKELITEEELMSQLREQGVDDIRKVKSAYEEGDGRISVMSYEGQSHPHKKETTG
jgi:uncharacterized membrane protein YcaP (DUF421 family)